LSNRTVAKQPRIFELLIKRDGKRSLTGQIFLLFKAALALCV